MSTLAVVVLPSVMSKVPRCSGNGLHAGGGGGGGARRGAGLGHSQCEDRLESR
jgi:hypothetical protein